MSWKKSLRHKPYVLRLEFGNFSATIKPITAVAYILVTSRIAIVNRDNRHKYQAGFKSYLAIFIRGTQNILKYESDSGLTS